MPFTALRVRTLRAFTLTELLAAIAIVGVLAALLFGLISGMRAASEQSKCLSNLRQIGVLAKAWTADNRGIVLPHEVRPPNQAVEDSKDWWPQLLAPYLGLRFSHANSTGTLRELACPTGLKALDQIEGSRGWNPTYAMFGSQKNLPAAAITDPAKKVYIGDSPWSGQRRDWNGVASRTPSYSDTEVADPRGIIFRHRQQANFLFHDGHVASFRHEDLPLPPRHADGSSAYRAVFDWTYSE